MRQSIPETRDDGPAVEPRADAARNLDVADFDTLFREMHGPLYAFSRARVGPDHADEIVAESFVTAWRLRERIAASPARPESWLFGIATKVIARHRRAEHRWLGMCADTAKFAPNESDHENDYIEADERSDAARSADRLAAAMKKLPRRELDPLLLHVLGGLPYEEISIVLEIPLGTVRSRISRARANLNRRLGTR